MAWCSRFRYFQNLSINIQQFTSVFLHAVEIPMDISKLVNLQRLVRLCICLLYMYYFFLISKFMIYKHFVIHNVCKTLTFASSVEQKRINKQWHNFCDENGGPLIEGCNHEWTVGWDSVLSKSDNELHKSIRFKIYENKKLFFHKKQYSIQKLFVLFL